MLITLRAQRVNEGTRDEVLKCLCGKLLILLIFGQKLNLYIALCFQHFFYPLCELKHTSIDTIFVWPCAFVAPRYHAGQIKPPLVLARQWPSTIVLTSVNASFRVSRTQSSGMNVSMIGLGMVANTCRNQTYFGFSQNVRFSAIPLGVTPASDETLLSPREPYPRSKKANWRHKLVIDCGLRQTDQG